MLTKNYQLHRFKHKNIYSELKLLRAGKYCYFHVIPNVQLLLK